MFFNYKTLVSAIVMSDTRDVLPSIFISVDDPTLMLSSIEDMYFESDSIVFKFPFVTYLMGKKDVVMGGQEKYEEFVDYLKTENDFIISICDKTFNVRSSFVANYTKH